MRDKIFYIICFGFLLGVLWRSFSVIDTYFVLVLGVISVAVFLFYYLLSQEHTAWGVLIAVLVVAVCAGVLRYDLADKTNPNTPEAQVGERVTLEGRIIDEASIGEYNQKLTVELNNKTKILVSTNLEGRYAYGDEISFSGVLRKPENFITDQGKEFDYINYLRKDGIIYTMSYADITVVSRGGGSLIKRGLFRIKEKFLEKINRNIAHPESLLMGGLILGERASFGEELRQKFIDTGTIHIVALSGYNVTIVAEWFMDLFSFLPRNFGIGMGILAIFLFVIMTGGSSTAVRAGIMASLALLARATGRNYDVGRALVLAAVVMVLFNPFILAFDVSFQLSVIATVAVIFLAPRIEKYFIWVTRKFGLRDVVTITTAAYIFVFPFILYKMGNFSLVALPANVLILPFIPLTMMLGFLTGLLGAIWYVLAVPLGYLSYLLLHYELGVIGTLARLPFAALTFSKFPLIPTLLIYAYFVYYLFGSSIMNFFRGGHGQASIN